jgi:hypothetical protein
MVMYISKDLMYPDSVCCRAYTYLEAVESSSCLFVASMSMVGMFSGFSGNGLMRAVWP